jgi:addiction module HigA family antidote
MRRLYPYREPKVAPAHPGALMREILTEHVKMPITEAARRMGVSRGALHGVLDERSTVTVDMALRFARLVGGNAELFVHMQEGHDFWHARQRLRSALEKIRPAA